MSLKYQVTISEPFLDTPVVMAEFSRLDQALNYRNALIIDYSSGVARTLIDKGWTDEDVIREHSLLTHSVAEKISIKSL